MATTTDNSPIHADQSAILAGIEEIVAAARRAPFAELLDFEGIDVADVLLSPIFLNAMNALRTNRCSPAPSGLVARARAWAAYGKHRWAESRAVRSALPVTPADVLLWPREITHVTVLEKVLRALRSLQVNCRTLTCQPSCFADARRQGLAPALTSAAWPGQFRAAKAEGRRRVRLLDRAGPWKFSSLALPVGPLLEASIRATICQHLEAASGAITNAREALDRFQPKVLVVGNDVTFEGRAACRVAAQRGIPTAALMHGNVTGNVLHARHCVDRFIVYGEIHRQDLIERGLPPEQLVVCGAPHLDARPGQSGIVDARLSSLLGITTRRPWILVATSGPGHAVSHGHHQQILQHLEQLAASLPDVPLVFKLHRKDQVKHYQAMLSACKHRNIFVIPKQDTRFSYDIFDWLQGCPLVLTGTSTVAVEAMLMDVPVITMDFCGETRDVDFIDAGATLHVRTRDELECAVRRLLADCPPAEQQRRAQAYVTGAFHRLDGQSARRSAEAICNLGQLPFQGPAKSL